MTWPVYMMAERTHYGVDAMAKKKTPQPEHVTLSKEAVAKLLANQTPQPGPDIIVLTPFDMLELERSEARATAAQTLVRIARLEKNVITLTRQLQDIETNRRLQEISDGTIKAAEAHRTLADEMAARYGFSWKTHSYQPETGEVTAADPEN